MEKNARTELSFIVLKSQLKCKEGLYPIPNECIKVQILLENKIISILKMQPYFDS